MIRKSVEPFARVLLIPFQHTKLAQNVELTRTTWAHDPVDE